MVFQESVSLGSDSSQFLSLGFVSFVFESLGSASLYFISFESVSLGSDSTGQYASSKVMSELAKSIGSFSH